MSSRKTRQTHNGEKGKPRRGDAAKLERAQAQKTRTCTVKANPNIVESYATGLPKATGAPPPKGVGPELPGRDPVGQATTMSSRKLPSVGEKEGPTGQRRWTTLERGPSPDHAAKSTLKYRGANDPTGNVGASPRGCWQGR